MGLPTVSHFIICYLVFFCQAPLFSWKPSKSLLVTCHLSHFESSQLTFCLSVLDHHPEHHPQKALAQVPDNHDSSLTTYVSNVIVVSLVLSLSLFPLSSTLFLSTDQSCASSASWHLCDCWMSLLQISSYFMSTHALKDFVVYQLTVQPWNLILWVHILPLSVT